jgi:hypothetical protein
MPEYETLNKFDRAYAGLIGGNNLLTKPTTVENVEKMTGEAETFVVQTIRNTEGDNIIVKYMDKEGVKRLILPPKVASTIGRQHDALSAKSRSIASKQVMKERMDRGEVPGFTKRSTATS